MSSVAASAQECIGNMKTKTKFSSRNLYLLFWIHENIFSERHTIIRFQLFRFRRPWRAIVAPGVQVVLLVSLPLFTHAVDGPPPSVTRVGVPVGFAELQATSAVHT